MKHFLLKTMLLLCALVVGGSAWAEDVTISFGTADGAWNAHTNDSYTDSDSRTWSRTFSAGNKQSGNTDYSQFGNSSNTCTSLILTATAGSNFNLTTFSVTMAGASQATAGTIYLYKRTSGGSETQLATVSVSGNSNVTCSFSGSESFSSTDILKVSYVGTAKAIQIKSLSYSYSTGGGGSTTYSVTYDGNGKTSGDVPTDATAYSSGATVTVFGNSGSLAKTGYSFGGWNTQADGNGDDYDKDDTFTIIANTTLYAKWIPNPYTVTLGDDSSTLTEASSGAGVTLPSRSAIGDYTFAGWSETNVTTETTTAPTIILAGSYTPSANITLYPVYTRTETGGGTQNKTASVTISDYATANSWVNNTKYTSVTLDGNATATVSAGSTNTGKYYTSNNSWRFYANESGALTISTNGELTSITLTYTGNTLTYGGNNVTSGTAVSVSGTSAEFAVSGSSSNTQVTAISVNYTITGGTTTYYLSTPSGNEKLDNAITGINATYTVDLANNEDEVDLSGATATSNGTVLYEVTNSTIDTADYDLTNGVLTVSANGVITIRAYVQADATYSAAEKVVTVTVKDNPVNLYDGATEDTEYGTPYVVDASLIEGGDITLSSSNTAVATVSGLTITPVAVGSTTITINTAATDIWHEGIATFTMNVTAPAGSTKAPSSDVTYTFDFTDNSEWNFPEGSDNKITTEADYTADGKTITVVGSDGNGYYYNNSDHYFLMGKNGATLTFPAFDKPVTQIDVVGRTGASGKVTQNIYVGATAVSTATTNATETHEYVIDSEYQAAGTIYSLMVTNANNTQITSVVVHMYQAPTVSATLNGSGYATFCSEYPLDFTNTTDVTAWKITDISSSNVITFEKVTGAVKGGTGLFLVGTAGETVNIPSADSDNELTGNLLVGTTAPTYLPAGVYGLSGDSFKKSANAGVIKANRAYLPGNLITESGDAPIRFEFVDEATGISEMKTFVNDSRIYNLNGQEVKNPVRGIYIQNGKKVYIK